MTSLYNKKQHTIKKGLINAYKNIYGKHIIRIFIYVLTNMIVILAVFKLDVTLPIYKNSGVIHRVITINKRLTKQIISLRS